MCIKDKLHYFFVVKNNNIYSEYREYVGIHQAEHQKHRLKHWIVLMKLNWHYRILRKKTSYFNFTIPTTNKNSKKSGTSTSSAPYMDGVEASKRKIPTAYGFARELMQYDVISFDVFDTLILRKLNDPKDIFALVGERLGIFNFYTIRIKAETEVRQEKAALFHNNECTLQEIYERVAYYTGIDDEQGIAAELEIEYDMCFANPYMMQVYQILRAQGKNIYITSNMYLSKSVICDLLEKCGYSGMKDVLVSCDYQCGKTNGSLFNILLSKVPVGSKIVHVGDNVAADINGAKIVGIASKYYQSCRELGLPHRSKGMSPLIGSAYFATVNNCLHNGVEIKKDYSALWEYGFVYGGIIALGYVNWMHKKALDEGITKLLFLSRDGYVLYKTFKLLYDDIETEYVYWSRIAAIRNTSAGERDTLLTRVFYEMCGKGVTIEQCLSLVRLEKMKTLFEENDIDTTWPIQSEYVKKICNILTDNWNIVEEELCAGKNVTRKYIGNLISEHKKVAIVDLGWSGKNDLPLKRIVEENGNGMKCKIFLLGSICRWQNIADILDENIECYMFDAHYNREIHDRFYVSRPKTLEIIEKLFNAPHNSFLGFDGNGHMEYAPPEAENYILFKETEKGILDFCQQYMASFRKYPFLCNISGYDAFIPIRMVLGNKKFYNKIFEDITFNDGIFPNNRHFMKEIL